MHFFVRIYSSQLCMCMVYLLATTCYIIRLNVSKFPRKFYIIYTVSPLQYCSTTVVGVYNLYNIVYLGQRLCVQLTFCDKKKLPTRI